MSLQVTKQENKDFAKTDCIYVKQSSFKYILIKNNVYKVVTSSLYSEDKIYLNLFQREGLKVILDENITFQEYKDNVKLKDITFIISKLSSKQHTIDITDEMIIEIKKKFLSLYINKDHYYSFNNMLKLYPNTLSSGGIIDENTIIQFITVDKTINISSSDQLNCSLFKENFNFNEMGIGGLDKEFEVIFRRAFSSNAASNSGHKQA